nr:hypothetical protein [Cytophagales bacterium]
MIKIIWGLIGLNTIGLFVFTVALVVTREGKPIDLHEKSVTFFLLGIGLFLILIAAIPLYFKQSTFTLIFSGFFAALPIVIALGISLSNAPAFWKSKSSFATTYYTDKMQRRIASAIEQGDTTLLKEAIIGQDLILKSNKIWNAEGLNYLQFAIRIRSNPIEFPFDDEKNKAVIRFLIDKGLATTPALAEATKYLPLEMISLLLDAGADPNCKGFVYPSPLLFELIANDEEAIDKAILLLERGANVNAKNDINLTPVMYAAYNARHGWKRTWRLVLYMLEKANADYTYTTDDGNNLATIIMEARAEAEAGNETMPEEFYQVVAWLKKNQVITEP